MTNPSLRDAKGRPLVAVTGLGIVTSLGQGQTDNWAALTAGRSGIHAIRRFATDGLRTRIAGTVDFLDTDPLVAPALSQRFAEEAARGSDRAGRHRRTGRLSRRPVHRRAPGGDRVATAPGARRSLRPERPDHLHGSAARRASRRFDAWHDLFIFGTVADQIADRFGTRARRSRSPRPCSSGATAIQLGVEAIRRGEVAAALCIGTDGSVNRNR